MIEQSGNRNAAIGALFIIIAFFFAAIRSAFVKAACFDGLPVMTVMLFQSVFSLCFLSPWIFIERRKVIETGRIGLHLARTITGFTALFLFFWSITHTTLAKAILLNSSAPLFVPLIAFILFRTKITPAIAASITVGFAGIVLILKPEPQNVRLGDAAALISGVLAAFSIIILRVLRKNGEEKTVTIVLYYILTILVASFALWLPDMICPKGITWLYIIMSSLFFVLFQLFFTSAFKYSTASKISPFIYFGVIFGAAIDSLVWNNKPGKFVLFGAGLVIVGSILAITRGKDDNIVIG